jgi:hypothetical protein
MTARSAGPVKLLSRVERLVETELEEAIEDLDWNLDDDYDLPKCDDKDCERCERYFNHIAAADRGMEVEEFEKLLDDDEKDDAPEEGQLDKLWQLVYLRARQKADGLDLTDPAARGRIEGILAEMYDDKNDTLKDRDGAVARATVAQAKIDALEVEKQTLLQDRAEALAARDAAHLQVAILEERLRHAEEDNERL